ncbi:uncharacterized protein DUF4309 [Tumebacillus sp. BK434]|uniref:YjgB family protein n=1 Tax=Tumebacillus sp. BK434 TaxID=2512169 RepID=UPI001053DC36|nr:YjgB family protein [Tumebacillus sp. BK434]TCP52870.1 uncharacterized protein DUF4309 [Tumebacillus sp. BK434]
MKPDHEPNWTELSRRELSRADRQEIWEGLNKRIVSWEHEQPKRRQRRIGRAAVLSFAATATAATLLFVLLPLRDTPQQAPSPTAQQPYQQEADPRALLEQLLASAQLGMVPDCTFIAGAAKIGDVERVYGPADLVDTAGDGRYATYEAEKLAFGFTETDLVYDVRSYRPELRNIRYQDVKTVLGQPEKVTSYEDSQTTQDILHYRTGARYDLLLIFPRPTSQQPNPRLHHISVLQP